MSNLSLKAKLLLGSSVTLVLMVVLGVISINGINSLIRTNQWVDHTHEVIASADEIVASAVNMETGMRGYLLAGKEEFLDPYKSGQKQFSELVASLSKTVDDNPAQVKLLGEAKATIDEWQAKVTEPTIALRREIGDAKTMNDMAKLVGEAKGKVYFDKFREQIKTFIEREKSLLAKRQKDGEAAGNHMTDNLKTMVDTTKWVNHTYEVVGGIEAALMAIVDMETGMRGYLLSGKEEFLEPYNSGIKEFDAIIGKTMELVNDNPAQVQRLEELDKVHDEWQQEVTRPAVELRRSVVAGSRTMDDVVALVAMAKGKKYVDDMRQKIAAFKKIEVELLAKRQQESSTATSATAGNLKTMGDVTGWINHTHEVILVATNIIAAAVDMETGMRGYLLAGKEEFLDPYKGGQKQFSELVASLSKTVDDNPAQVKLLGEAKATIDEWQAKAAEPAIALRREIGDAKTMDDMARLIGEAKGKVYFDKFRGQMATFTDREKKLMQTRQADARNTAKNSRYMIIGGIAAAVLMALVIAFLLSQFRNPPLQADISGTETVQCQGA